MRLESGFGSEPKVIGIDQLRWLNVEPFRHPNGTLILQYRVVSYSSGNLGTDVNARTRRPDER